MAKSANLNIRIDPDIKQEADDIIAGRIQTKRFTSFREFTADMENDDAGI